MSRPQIICHMVTSLDGQVTGDFLFRPECEAATEVYYEINRAYKESGGNGFICGRVTMEQSFTGGRVPELSGYQEDPQLRAERVWLGDAALSGYYAVAFDPKGKLCWQSPLIEDNDPGYDKAQVIEVLSEQVDTRYLAYLRERGIPYLIAGKTCIDVTQALELLHRHFGIRLLLLEGGSIVNGYFMRADCVDALSLVQAPLVAQADAKPLFMDALCRAFTLTSAESRQGVLVMHYTAADR